MPKARKARAVGFNHVALEVGDIEEALAFYGRLFEFKLRGKSKTSAFIDLGDQFIALQKGRKQPPDDGRHFGLVVDDKETVRRALAAAGIKPLPGPFLDFRDPWGNRIEIVGYDNIQFTKAPHVLRGMGLAHLSKNAKAINPPPQAGEGMHRMCGINFNTAHVLYAISSAVAASSTSIPPVAATRPASSSTTEVAMRLSSPAWWLT